MISPKNFYWVAGLSTLIVLIGGGLGVRHITKVQQQAALDEHLRYIAGNVDTLTLLWKSRDGDVVTKGDFSAFLEQLLGAVGRDTVIVEKVLPPVEVTQEVHDTVFVEVDVVRVVRDTINVPTIIRFEPLQTRDPRRSPRFQQEIP